MEDLCNIHDVRDSAWKEQPQRLEASLTTTRAGTSEVGSSEEDDDDEEPSVSSQPQTNQAASSISRETVAETGNAPFAEGKPPLPMVDYIFNVVSPSFLCLFLCALKAHIFLDEILGCNSEQQLYR